MSKLYIFTLHWNNVDKLKRLHASLIPALEYLSIDYKWMIKDNGSIDSSREFIESILSDKISCYFAGHNRDSFSVGMNVLFEQSNAEDEDYILLLNNDLWFGDDQSIGKMIDVMKDDSVGMVGVRLLYPNSNKLQHAGVYFSKKYGYLPYHYRYNEESDKEAEKTREFQAVTAALVLTKAKYYRNICKNDSGRVGLDERLFWCFDDIDACLSIKYNQGKKIVYCGGAFAYHEESASLKKNPINKAMSPHNVRVFKEKWSGIYKKDD